jgi:hypothetical protein
MTFRTLNPEAIVQTIALLNRRIAERFPNSNLRNVAEELAALAEQARATVETPKRLFSWYRLVAMLLVVGIVGSIVMIIPRLEVREGPLSWTELAQGFEAFINDLVFGGIAIFFLATMETRMKRRKILASLHDLRSLAHVIDMHQLTKDPQRFTDDHDDTESSPHHPLKLFQLTRYLDYCSEMLSLVGKLAALYSKDTGDGVVLSAVDEVETLTNSLSRKIWQKIMIVFSLEQRTTAPAPAVNVTEPPAV